MLTLAEAQETSGDRIIIFLDASNSELTIRFILSAVRHFTPAERVTLLPGGNHVDEQAVRARNAGG